MRAGKVRYTGATFHSDVTTAGAFEGAEYAVFQGDTASGVPRILMPTGSQLARLKTRAGPGHLALNGSTSGTLSQAGMRIHLLSRTIAGEQVGFLRVYRNADASWVTGDVPAGGMLTATNCGHFHADAKFYSHAYPHPDSTSRQLSALKSSSRRCYLGGADSIWKGTFTTPDPRGGTWDVFPGTVHPAVASQPDAAYLFPLDRRYNPGFRGIVHVEGKAVVSGTVRGRLTIAASGNIIIGDDIRYATDPGSGSCTDMLGLFSGGQIIIADNMLNSPQVPASGEAWYTYDDTRDETIHASLLALDRITVENYASGSTYAEPCGTQTWGRGCLFVNGGLIQATRGIVSMSNGTGYVKRYTHDACGLTDPPPYFPSTGHFWRSRYYEMDPTGFDVAAYFRALN